MQKNVKSQKSLGPSPPPLMLLYPDSANFPVLANFAAACKLGHILRLCLFVCGKFSEYFILIFSQLRELLTEGVTDENKELLDVS